METIKLGTYSIHISPNIDTVMDISNKKLLLCHKSALNTIGLFTYNEQTDTIKFNCRWAIHPQPERRTVATYALGTRTRQPAAAVATRRTRHPP